MQSASCTQPRREHWQENLNLIAESSLKWERMYAGVCQPGALEYHYTHLCFSLTVCVECV